MKHNKKNTTLTKCDYFNHKVQKQNVTKKFL